MEERPAKMIVIIGYTGTGKTTMSKRLILAELKKGGRALIVTPDAGEFLKIPEIHPKFPNRIEWYKGARRVIYFKGLLPIIASTFTRGLLLFDDCRAYIEARTAPDLLNILIRRRQRMIDIVAAGHGFTQIPPAFFTFASEYILFQTIDNIDSRKGVISNFEALKEAQARINTIASNGKPHYFEIIKPLKPLSNP